jgi:hypothetical protein
VVFVMKTLQPAKLVSFEAVTYRGEWRRETFFDNKRFEIMVDMFSLKGIPCEMDEP